MRVAELVAGGVATRATSEASPVRELEPRTVVLDASLSLINRTGAHYIAETLCDALGKDERVVVRRWRTLGGQKLSRLRRKVMGRLMLEELQRVGAAPWLRWPEPAGADLQRVFLDPLYVLRSALARSDIVLCHDVGPLTHPQLYDDGTVRLYRAAYEKILAVRPGMVFVSEASRVAFEHSFGTGFRLREVISPLVRLEASRGDVEPVVGVRAPFFLTVGALEARKNQAHAIRAFGESGLHARGHSYVLCGPPGVGVEEARAAASQTAGTNLLGYVTDSQLRWLYKHATAFVLPSLLEGFGMPALEAALHGLIPILSRDSALTEAVAALGVAVDPYSRQELAAAMCRVAELDDAERSRWGEHLTAHARQATPERFVASWRALLSADRGAR